MSTWSRRDFITLVGAAIAASRAPTAGAIPPAGAPRDGGESLDVIAQRKGMRFGSAIAYYQLSDPSYRGLMRSQCGIMVTENERRLCAALSRHHPELRPAEIRADLGAR